MVKCTKFIFSLDRVMRMERMRGEALERKRGLEVEWSERGIERRPLTAEGINTELPLPLLGVPLWVQRGRVETHKSGNSHSFLNLWLRPRS